MTVHRAVKGHPVTVEDATRSVREFKPVDLLCKAGDPSCDAIQAAIEVCKALRP